MPKITYQLDRGLGLWTSLSPSDSELTLLFSPMTDGYIKIKETVYRVKSGELTVPLSELPDGSYSLRLETEGEGFKLESFEKSHRGIEMKRIDEDIERALIKSAMRDRKRLDALEEKITVLMNRTEGHHIFN